MVTICQKLILTFWQICDLLQGGLLTWGHILSSLKVSSLSLMDSKEKRCRNVSWVCCASLCGLKTEFLNDILIKCSCCQILFAFAFRTVCINNERLILKVIYIKFYSHVPATVSSSTLVVARANTLWMNSQQCVALGATDYLTPCPVPPLLPPSKNLTLSLDSNDTTAFWLKEMPSCLFDILFWGDSPHSDQVIWLASGHNLPI